MCAGRHHRVRGAGPWAGLSPSLSLDLVAYRYVARCPMNAWRTTIMGFGAEGVIFGEGE